MADLVFLVGYADELYDEIKMILKENEYKVVKVPLGAMETFTTIHRPKAIIFLTDGKNKVLHEIARTTRKKHPEITMVFIAERADKQLVANVFQSGGSALVLKSFVGSKLLNVLGRRKELNSSMCV